MRLSAPEAIRIAQLTAGREGWKLTNSKRPEVFYQYSQNDGTWSVLCYGSVYDSSVSEFWIVIDDKTSKTHLMRAD